MFLRRFFIYKGGWKYKGGRSLLKDQGVGVVSIMGVIVFKTFLNKLIKAFMVCT